MYSRQDDFIHQPTENPNWRESHYWNFFDQKLKIGGYFSIGKRPATKNSGYILALWKDGRFLYGMDYGKFLEFNDEWEVGSMKFECGDPLKTWRVRYDDLMPDFGSETFRLPREDIIPVSKNDRATIPVKFDLNFQALHDFYNFQLASPDFDHNYYEQLGRYDGFLQIGDEKYNLAAYGMRNHVWGFRNWFAPKKWRWTSVWFDEGEMYFGVHKVTLDHDTTYGAFLYRNGKNYKVVELSEETKVRNLPDSPKPLPLEIRYELKDETGFSMDIVGKVLHVVPTVFQKKEKDGGTLLSWNDKCLTEYTSSLGQKAWGELEVVERLSV
jgi:hypothetical protein